MLPGGEEVALGDGEDQREAALTEVGGDGKVEILGKQQQTAELLQTEGYARILSYLVRLELPRLHGQLRVNLLLFIHVVVVVLDLKTATFNKHRYFFLIGQKVPVGILHNF